MFVPPLPHEYCAWAGLDLDALGIVDGKFCWVVFVDILVLQVNRRFYSMNQRTSINVGHEGYNLYSTYGIVE